jgi:hypothetical protein
MRALAAALLLWLAPSAGALQSNAGANTGQFLNVGAGARALGMGEAYGPVAEGAEAMYWNPAGLAQLRRPEFTYTRSEFATYFHHDFAAYARPALGGAVGFAYTRLSQDALPVVTNANQQLGTFAPHSDAVAVGYAYAFDLAGDGLGRVENDVLDQRWSVPGVYRPLGHERDLWTGSLLIGGSVKYISESIYDASASAFAVDGGALFRPYDLERVSLSATFRNLGTKERFLTESESLPAEMDLGLAYDHRSDEFRLLPALELALPYYGNPSAKIGLEYTSARGSEFSFSVRAGYKSLQAVDLGPLAGATFGAGVRYRRFMTDFGLEPMAGLGQAYRLTIGMAW